MNRPHSFVPGLAGLALIAAAPFVAPTAPGHADAVAVIDEEEIEADVLALAAPEMEGRDSPSEGFRRAQELLAERLASYGYRAAPDRAPATGGETGEEGRTATAADLLRPYTRELWKPVPEECELVLELPGEQPRVFTYGEDFVPLLDSDGAAEAPVSFAGFAIVDSGERYDDLRGVDVEDRVVVVLEGEPRHRRKFGGDEDFTDGANVWTKLGELMEHGDGPAGVLLVRRRADGADEENEDELDFRHSHASFNGRLEPVQSGRQRAPVARRRPPVLEIDVSCASELLGKDVAELAERIDKTGRPMRVSLDGQHDEAVVRMRSKTTFGRVECHNVVGWLQGTDPEIDGQAVVVGAHYDHIGVSPSGIVGAGADDNATGCAALLQVAEAFAASPPRRSVLICFFGSEEDGLHGSKAIAQNPPVDRDAIVAMLNLDMIGRGDEREVAVLGINQNPDLEDVLERAQDLSRTGVREIVMRRGEELFARSDQYSFHEVGIPVLFFFEGLPISRNRDYHTWRDVPEHVQPDKVRNTARLAFNTAWILANDDDTPPRPR